MLVPRSGRGLELLPHNAILDEQPRGVRIPCLGRDKLHAGHGADGGQGLAPKPQGLDSLQVFGGGNLAGGVAMAAEQGVARLHAATVVHHLKPVNAAVLDVDGDLLGPGVQAVFKQLLGHRGGALHHLARGNAFHEQVGEDVNFTR